MHRFFALFLTLPLLFCTCSPTTKPDQPGKIVVTPSKPAATDPELVAIIQARTKGELEKGLQLAEKALEKDKKRANIWGEHGYLCYLLATRPGGGGGFFKATQSLEKAISLGTEEPTYILMLATIYRKKGYNLKAGDLADKALTMPLPDHLLANAYFEAGMVANRQLAEASGKGGALDRKVLLRNKALEYLGKTCEMTPQNTEAWIYLSNTWAWAGDNTREMEILEKAIAQTKPKDNLHTYYQDRLFALQLFPRAVKAYTERTVKDPKDAMAQWYLGRALKSQAQAHRDGKDNKSALDCYLRAEQAWLAARKLKPEYAASCDESIAMALLGAAWLHIDKMELDQAGQALARAFAAWPQVFNTPDKYRVTYLVAIGAIGQRLLGGKRGFLSTDPKGGYKAGAEVDQQESLKKVVKFYRTLIARHADREDYQGFWYNNVGLALRDLGSLLAGGKESGRFGVPIPPAARKAWEDSYRAYSQAISIYPDDPRILNDCALIQIYHLGTELDRAEKMLLHARAECLRLLEEEAESMNTDRRQFLEEALGDTWYNQAMLYFHHKKDRAKARDFVDESFKYYPRKQESPTPIYPWPALEKKGPEKAPKQDREQARFITPQTLPHLCVYDLQDPAPVDELTAMEKQIESAYQQEPEAAKSNLAELVYQLEKRLRKDGKNGRLNFLMGRALQGLANAQRRSRRPNGMSIDSNLEEAGLYFTAAVKADRNLISAWFNLILVQLERGTGAAAATTSRQAAALFPTWHDMPAEKTLAVAAMAGHALYCQYARTKAAANKSGGRADEKDGLLAVTLLRRVLARGLQNNGKVPGVGSPEVAILDLAKVHQWQGKEKDAVKVLAEWLAVVGRKPKLLSTMFTIGRIKASAELIAACKAMDGKYPKDPTILWYLGATHCEAADQARLLGKWDIADKGYDQAIATMRQVITLAPAFKTNSQTYIVRSLSGKGWTARGRRKPSTAAGYFLAALKENPAMKNTQDADRQTPAQGILYITDDLKNANQVNKAIKVYQEALKFAPEEVNWSNNMAFFAREYGVSLFRSGYKKEANKIFRTSLWGYKNAIKYSPEDPRLLNDLALIQIYYIREEAGQALVHLQKAVKCGAQQLKDFDPQDLNGRQLLDEAVGDAWQNLGYYYLNLKRDLDKAEKNLKQSLLHFSPSRRAEARGMLRMVAQGRALLKKLEEDKKRKAAQKEAAKKAAEAEKKTGAGEGKK